MFLIIKGGKDIEEKVRTNPHKAQHPISLHPIIKPRWKRQEEANWTEKV